MYGKFALKFFLGLTVGLIWSAGVMAAQKGTVTADEAFIYDNADFDAKIIATVRKGEVFDISDNTKGPFYKIRLKDKSLGWISSVDIEPGRIKIPKKKAEPLKSYKDEKKAENRFIILRWRGLRVELLDWKEKTLGKVRQDQMTLAGWGWTGLDTMMDGPFYMDTSVTLAWQAPDYYKKVTGVSATGWILKAQTALLSPRPVGENFIYFYGLGPSVTFSKFETGLIESGGTVRYSSDDLTLGLVFPLGFSYRLSTSIALSGWYRFYWEKQITSGLSFGLGFTY